VCTLNVPIAPNSNLHSTSLVGALSFHSLPATAFSCGSRHVALIRQVVDVVVGDPSPTPPASPSVSFFREIVQLSG